MPKAVRKKRKKAQKDLQKLDGTKRRMSLPTASITPSTVYRTCSGGVLSLGTQESVLEPPLPIRELESTEDSDDNDDSEESETSEVESGSESQNLNERKKKRVVGRKSSGESTSRLIDLPNEILFKIISMCSVLEIKKLCYVSKRMKIISGKSLHLLCIVYQQYLNTDRES